MHHASAIGAAIITGFTLVQHCPAPVWAIVPAIASVVVAGLKVGVAELDKRELPNGGFELNSRLEEMSLEARQGGCFQNVDPGVPAGIQESCCSGLSGATVTVTGTPDGVISISGLPYDCIPLAPWIDGTGTVPYACGDDCIEYAGLPAEQYNGLKEAFEGRA